MLLFSLKRLIRHSYHFFVLYPFVKRKKITIGYATMKITPNHIAQLVELHNPSMNDIRPITVKRYINSDFLRNASPSSFQNLFIFSPPFKFIFLKNQKLLLRLTQLRLIRSFSYVFLSLFPSFKKILQSN